MKSFLLVFAVMFCGLIFAAEATKVNPVRKMWNFQTSLGANLGYNYNRNFLSLQNGQIFSPGLQLTANLDFEKLQHEWRNELSISEGWSLTTPQTTFIKSSDMVHLKTTYLYHVLPMFGPYASAKLRTSMFPGADVWPSQYTYIITDAATGKQWTQNATGSAQTGTFVFPLTQAFLPLILEQDIGVFFQPYKNETLFLEFKLGATTRQNIAKNQRILTAVGVVYNDTPVRQLDNVYELGPSTGFVFKGSWFDKKISYQASMDVLWSALQVPMFSVDSGKRWSFDASSLLSFNLLSWLSLRWNFKAILNPAILNQVQLMSHVLLTVNYSD